MTLRAGALTVLLAVSACAGGDQRVVGTVVAVDGDLTTVSAFEVQTDAGSRMRFVPAPELTTFTDAAGDAGAPITHLWDHLRDGAPVRVTYRDEHGTLVALIVEDR